jgi:starch synthase
MLTNSSNGAAPLRVSATHGGKTPANILFVTSEIADLLKSGGLGEISAYLPRVLRRQGMDVRVLIPGYRAILNKIQDITVVADLPPLADVPPCQIGLWQADDGLPVYVLICPELYDRDGSPYGDDNGNEFGDNDIRFARLGLAAAEIVAGVPEIGWSVDLVHVNDWLSALTPAYMAWRGIRAPSILTVHNLAYQGVFDRQRAPALGVPDAAFQTEGVEFYGKLSFLKAGLYYASHVTTVSPTYASEIQTEEMGGGLDGLLRERANRGQLTGILNGIDDSYDPRHDPHLRHHFNSDDLAGKQSNAAEVREVFGLKDHTGPLFALVSRLVHQKGVDLVVEAASSIVAQGGQVVATGQGDRKLENAMKNLADRHPGSIGVEIGFEEALARRMYAGSDFLLMPSRFEPCGLSQMYAQRYGTLPIARSTGGLVDTIHDNVTGFLFENASAGGLRRGIDRAITAFRSQGVLGRMKTAAMKRPAGWNKAAEDYVTVYRRAMDAA